MGGKLLWQSTVGLVGGLLEQQSLLRCDLEGARRDSKPARHSDHRTVEDRTENGERGEVGAGHRGMEAVGSVEWQVGIATEGNQPGTTGGVSADQMPRANLLNDSSFSMALVPLVGAAGATAKRSRMSSRISSMS